MTRKLSRMGWMSGAAGAAMLCLAGAAAAQDYVVASDESVIVHPPYGSVEIQRLPGWHGIGKFFNPETRVSMSEPVDVGDLNLHRTGDRDELRYRIGRAAMRLCTRLEGAVPAGSVMETTTLDCIADATRNAMNDVETRDFYG